MTITWDLFILLFFGVLTIYGVLIGRDRILGILINIYVALFFTVVTGDYVYNFVSNFGFISQHLTATAFGTKVLLVVIIAGLLTLKSEVSGLNTAGTLSQTETGIYGFLTAGVLLSSSFAFMSEAQRISLNSNFANIVYNYHPVWVAAPILLMIGSAFFKR